MKVALVQVNRKHSIVKIACGHCGLAYLGTYALNLGHEVLAIDAMYEGIDNNGVTKKLIKFAPDVVGFSAKTPDIKEVENIAKIIKVKIPAKKLSRQLRNTIATISHNSVPGTRININII